MADPGDKSFLGRGWAFPPQFRPGNRGVDMVSAEEDIRESLLILLATSPGERLMHPTYGCGIRDLVFEGLSETLRTEISDLIETAILFFEPRITLHSVAAEIEDPLGGVLRITVEYTVRATNTRSNIVFPFYLNEGTSVQLTPWRDAP